MDHGTYLDNMEHRQICCYRLALTAATATISITTLEENYNFPSGLAKLNSKMYKHPPHVEHILPALTF
jgi:hypothetical protein